MKRGCAFALATLTILFIALVVGGAGFQWVNSQPWFCNSCHEMNFHYQSWQNSTHGANAECLECHAEPGLRGFIEEKVRGAEQLVAHVTGDYKVPIQIIVRVKNDQCLACHPETRTLPDKAIEVKHAKHMQKNVLCADCHNRIVHNQPDQLRVMPRDQCEICHKAHTRFALVGKHATLNCSQCHRGGNYTNMNRNCEACHKLPAKHIAGVTDGCDQCHAATGWKPAKFDHTKFPLVGKHQQITCDKCHVSGTYRGTSSNCEACHRLPPKHIAGITGGCDQCHAATGWKPAKFDHAKFPLAGKHQNVSCEQCHKNSVFRGTASSCMNCHASPATHAGLDPNCSRCHNVNGFKPATFAHRSVGEHIGARQEHPLTCVRCHPVRFTEKNCMGAGCHSSNNPKGEHD